MDRDVLSSYCFNDFLGYNAAEIGSKRGKHTLVNPAEFPEELFFINFIIYF